MISPIPGIALLISLSSASTFAAVLQVGPGRPLDRPSEAARVAQDGDDIRIEAGDYRGDVAVWMQDRLTIRGTGGRPRLLADGQSAEGKAIWVIKGDDTVVEDIAFSGAVVDDNNGAGIRLEGTNLTVRRCLFSDNENGILTGPNPDSEILVEHSEFARNGYGDGYTHNIYVGRIRKFTLRHSYLHRARVGHQVKSRAETNHILFNRIADHEDGNSSYLIDLPDPGTALVVGNELQQGPETDNWAMIRSVQQLFLVNNTLVNDRSSGVFVEIVGAAAAGSHLQNNLFVGSGRVQVGAAAQVTNLLTDDARLFDRRSADFRLTAMSPAIDSGSPVALDGFPAGVPDSEYRHPIESVPRALKRAPDIGAHEFPR